ncbi:MAG: phosphopentomutase/phosphoglucosamine mutase [Methanocorpusculum sp.]|nr:phosphopentomutase/phosphoglucosamine mutase [Methanocorpusculum sp.]MDE2524638.1 phosphopentomutase/phosphoglucosamine mutase [Methanocorpusculum sp.]
MLFGSSGIRRPFDQSLITLALLTGSAVAATAQTVILATDTRTSNQILADATISGLIASGAQVHYGDIAPTPTVALAAKHADAGVMITASHNPENYNGIKLFRPDGSSYTLVQQKEIEDYINTPEWKPWNGLGTITHTDIITPHRKIIQSSINLPDNLTIIVDCANGAGGQITPDVLKATGSTIIPVNCEPSGFFNRPSEPLEKNLLHIPSLIKKHNASCAVVNDGDADRMMAFDNQGRYINGDQLLMLFAQYLGAKQIVTTIDASMAIEEIGTVRRTPVGDSFVSEELISWGDFGGEPSGSWIFPRHSLCPDGVYAAALFCEIAHEWNIAEKLDEMPKYTILRDAVSENHHHEVLNTLGAENPTEGIRIESENGWYLIRASGTEPKIRCTAEGKTKKDAEQMLSAGMEQIKQAVHQLK